MPSPLVRESPGSPVQSESNPKGSESRDTSSDNNSWYVNNDTFHRRSSSSTSITSQLPYLLSSPGEINYANYTPLDHSTQVPAIMTPPDSPTTSTTTKTTTTKTSSERPQPSPLTSKPSATVTPTDNTATATADTETILSPEEEKVSPVLQPWSSNLHPLAQRLLSAAQVHKLSGNTLFSTSLYRPAIDAYELALSTTPSYLLRETAVLHSNIAACYLKLNEAELALTHATAAVEGRPGWAKAIIRRARAREALGSWQELEAARDDMKALLEGQGSKDASLEVPLADVEKAEVARSVLRVERQIEVVKADEVKQAMKGLKTLGDSVLKPFGFSTDNFGFIKDEKTGQYSMTFNRGGGDSSSKS